MTRARHRRIARKKADRAVLRLFDNERRRAAAEAEWALGVAQGHYRETVSGLADFVAARLISKALRAYKY